MAWLAQLLRQVGCLREDGRDDGGQFLTLLGERSDWGRRGGAMHELLAEFPPAWGPFRTRRSSRPRRRYAWALL